MVARYAASMPMESLRRSPPRNPARPDIHRPETRGAVRPMRPIRDIRSEADLEDAVRRCELRWRALEQGLREDEITALLSLGLDRAEAQLRALGPHD
jgi:hypothetical protein